MPTQTHDSRRSALCGCHLDARFAQLATSTGAHGAPALPRPGRRPIIVPTVTELIVRGRVVTMDPNSQVVEAIAISDGRITATGTFDEVDGLRSAETEVLDLGDHVAYPGFVEPHMHYWASAMFRGWTDVSTRDGRTFDEVLDRLATVAPIDGWILATQYDPALVAGERELTRDDLDRIHPDRPVFVMNASMHWAYVNSAALAAAGITDDTEVPAGGLLPKVDGRLTGAIGEIAAMAPFLAVLPRKDRAALERAIVEINREAATRGYTHTHDAGSGGLFGVDELSIMYGLRDELRARVTMAILDQAADAAIAAGVRPGDGDDMARVTHWKLVGDGSNQGYSGFQKDNYMGKDFRGEPNYTVEQLEHSIRRAHEHGFPMMIHANGDAAITQTIDAYERALDSGSGLARRDRIEHCSFATHDDLQRMATLGLSPSFLIGHVHYWGRAFRDRIIGPDKAARLDPIRSAQALGLRCSTHSDYTVTNFEPLQEIQTAVTRVMLEGGEVLGPDERVPVAEAMRLKTVDAAWQVHSDDAGTIEVGKHADLTILDRDPQQAEPADIAAIGVVRTIVAGRTVYEG